MSKSKEPSGGVDREGGPWGQQGRVQMPFVFLFQSRKINLFQEFCGNTLSFLGVFNDPSNRSRCSCESQLPGHSSFLLGVLEISLSLNCLGKSLVTFTCEWQPGKQTTHVGTASSHRLDHVDTALGDPGTSGHLRKGLKMFLFIFRFGCLRNSRLFP